MQHEVGHEILSFKEIIGNKRCLFFFFFNICTLAFKCSHTSRSGKARDTCPRHSESPVASAESGLDQERGISKVKERTHTTVSDEYLY